MHPINSFSSVARPWPSGGRRGCKSFPLVHICDRVSSAIRVHVGGDLPGVYQPSQVDVHGIRLTDVTR